MRQILALKVDVGSGMSDQDGAAQLVADIAGVRRFLGELDAERTVLNAQVCKFQQELSEAELRLAADRGVRGAEDEKKLRRIQQLEQEAIQLVKGREISDRVIAHLKEESSKEEQRLIGELADACRTTLEWRNAHDSLAAELDSKASVADDLSRALADAQSIQASLSLRLNKLEEELSEHEVANADLRSDLQKRDDSIRQLMHELEERDGKIARVGQAMRDAASSHAALQDELEGQHVLVAKQLSEAHQQLSMRSEELEVIAGQLREIESTSTAVCHQTTVLVDEGASRAAVEREEQGCMVSLVSSALVGPIAHILAQESTKQRQVVSILTELVGICRGRRYVIDKLNLAVQLLRLGKCNSTESHHTNDEHGHGNFKQLAWLVTTRPGFVEALGDAYHALLAHAPMEEIFTLLHHALVDHLSSVEKLHVGVPNEPMYTPGGAHWVKEITEKEMVRIIHSSSAAISHPAAAQPEHQRSPSPAGRGGAIGSPRTPPPSSRTQRHAGTPITPRSLHLRFLRLSSTQSTSASPRPMK